MCPLPSGSFLGSSGVLSSSDVSVLLTAAAYNLMTGFSLCDFGSPLVLSGSSGTSLPSGPSVSAVYVGALILSAYLGGS